VSRRKRWPGRVYLGLDETGKQRFPLGRPVRHQARAHGAVAEARTQLRLGASAALPTWDEYVDSYLADYGRRYKSSSADTTRQRLTRFQRDFAGRSSDVPRAEAKAWAFTGRAAPCGRS
jgi:hypothetical protein